MDRNTARDTIRTAAIWAGAFALVFLLWELRDGLLVIFAAIVLAVLLRSLANQIERIPGIGRRLGITLSILLVALTTVGTVTLFGAQVTGRLGQVVQQAQDALHNLQSNGSDSAGMMKNIGSKLSSGVADMLGRGFSLALSGIEAALMIAVTGLYIAVEPELYRKGLLKLISRERIDQTEEVLDLMQRVLVLWLLGQFLLMLLIGAMSFVALWLIGIPNAAGLALVAGIAEMVPYMGPFIGSVPAVLVAATLGLHQVLWTIGAFLLVHLVEGYLVAPLIQRRFITIPPAVVLGAITFAGLLFGLPGALMAAPLAIVGFVAVKLLYVRRYLHRPTDLPEPE